MSYPDLCGTRIGGGAGCEGPSYHASRRRFFRPGGRDDESGLTTLEWLLIVAAVAGLAALAVVLVTNVVDNTSEQISGSSARQTAAKVAAQEILDDATSAEQPDAVRSWADWEKHYNSKCDRLSITYGDAGITVNSVFHVQSGIVRAGLKLDGGGVFTNSDRASGKDVVAFEHTRIIPRFTTIDPDMDPATPGIQAWTVDEPNARPNFAKAMAVCAIS